ncbi:MAG: phBC6A51 family helix-turn-helix protein [Patescibacteria group bacterium]|nr:phBC6A51 family helix-turn-helix protein [Patescibacteria group bacterium]
MSQTIENRQSKSKMAILEQLKKVPIVQIACEKSGVGRATYYRWRLEDKQFSKEADDALTEGSLLVNDIAESQLMSAIRDKNLTAIIFWLKHHHAKYATKVEVTAQLKNMDEKLSPEQEALVTKALQLASLLPADKVETEGEAS